MAFTISNTGNFIKIVESVDVTQLLHKINISEVTAQRYVPLPSTREHEGNVSERWEIRIYMNNGRCYIIPLSGVKVDSDAEVTTPNNWVNTSAGAQQALTTLQTWIQTVVIPAV